MLDKTKRVETLAPTLATTLGFSEADAKIAGEAASLAKADLATQLVMEFTSLAGVMGKHYAAREGLDAKLCDAIFEAALPRSSGDLLPSSPAGIAVAVADRLDTLVGLFAVVGAPKATADPFGLRRAGVAAPCSASGQRRSLRRPRGAGGGGGAAAGGVRRGDGGRVRGIHDAPPGAVPRGQRLRHRGGARRAGGARRRPRLAAETARELDAVVKAKGSDALKTAMAVLARPTKLVRGKELPEDLEVRRDALVDAEEVALYDAYLAAREALGDGSASSVSDLLAAAATLSAPSEAFFDKVFVMAEDPELRRNRLALVNAVASLPTGIVDFAELPGF